MSLSIRWSQARYWVRQHPVLSGSIAAVVSWLILQAIDGIVENSAYDFFQKIVVPWLKVEGMVSNFTLIAIALGGTVIGLILSRLVFKHAHQRWENLPLLELKEYSNAIHFLRLQTYYEMIAEISQHAQPCLAEVNEVSLHHFIDSYFLDIFKHLGPEVVNGGGILLRDKTAPDWLYFWRMSPDQAVSPKRFYLGPAQEFHKHPAGVAALVYKEDSAQIVNIFDRINGKADHPRFHMFDMVALGYPRSIIPYDSFICLPIHWNSQVIGVLSIEGQKRGAFDVESKQLLQPVADQLGTVLAMCKHAGVNGYVL